MRKKFLVLAFLAVWVFITSVALIFGFTYNWPDNVHVDYGLPLTWGTHTLSTLIGAVDVWTVNITNLMLDLFFWSAIMILIAALLLYKLQ